MKKRIKIVSKIENSDYCRQTRVKDKYCKSMLISFHKIKILEFLLQNLSHLNLAYNFLINICIFKQASSLTIAKCISVIFNVSN